MKITRLLLLICLCCLIAVPAVWGQAPNTTTTTTHGILGYLDPHTGAFRPVPQVGAEETDAAAVTTVGGTISITITITLKSTGITTVTCGASTSVEDNLTSGSPTIFEEADEVAATGTGTTRTCKLSIPYAWALATASTDTMSTGYSVSGAATSTGGLPLRSSTRSPLDTRKVPSNGTTTTLTAAVTL